MSNSDKATESNLTPQTNTSTSFFDSSISIWALVIANFIPVIGGLFFGWDIRVVLIVYWAENLVIGFYNVLKMAMARSGPLGAKLFMIPFFMVHFGGFCAGHGFFIFIFMSMDAVGGDLMGDGLDSIMKNAFDWPGPLVFLGMLVGVIGYMWKNFGYSVVLPILGLMISHGISFWQNYIGKKEYEHRNVALQMFMPYGRIVVMHIAIIAAGVPIMLLGSPLPLLILLVIFKTITDVYFHNISHRKDGFLSVMPAFIKEKIEMVKEMPKNQQK